MERGRIRRWFDQKGWTGLLIGAPYVWLLIWFLLPFLIVVAMSVATNTATAPPFSFGGEHPWINLEPFSRVVTDGLYLRAFVTSLLNAAFAAFLCLSLIHI
jgi:putrescine transport system permease protein